MPEEHHSLRRIDFSSTIPGHVLQAIVIDVVCPYMAQQFLAFRLPIIPLQILLFLFPIAGIIFLYNKEQRIDIIGLLALLLLAIIVGSSYLPLDEGVLTLLRLCLFSGLFSLSLLLSHGLKKPIMLFIDRYFKDRTHGGTQTYCNYWQDNQSYQHTIYVMNKAWGWTQLALVAVLLLLFFVFSNAYTDLILLCVTIIVYLILIVWSISYKESREKDWLAQ